MVAVFGKFDDGARENKDLGITAYNKFVGSLAAGLGLTFTTLPESVPVDPGVSVPDITFTGTATAGKVTINVLLIDSPKSAPFSFWKRYNALSQKADMVLYNGHAGLGKNVDALAGQGIVAPHQYQMFFFNNCDTFAYLQDAFAKRRTDANKANKAPILTDPNGT